MTLVAIGFLPPPTALWGEKGRRRGRRRKGSLAPGNKLDVRKSEGGFAKKKKYLGVSVLYPR